MQTHFAFSRSRGKKQDASFFIIYSKEQKCKHVHLLAFSLSLSLKIKDASFIHNLFKGTKIFNMFSFLNAGPKSFGGTIVVGSGNLQGIKKKSD